MKVLFVWIMAFAINCWAITKPMETIEAYNAGGALKNGATLGGYTNDERITQWLSSEIFEETGWKDNKEYVHNSYVFNWRSFSKPANSSVNKARELGYRQWNVNGASAEIALEYCDASCTLPGTLKKTEISTTLPSGEKSSVVMEVVSAKARHILPAKMFNIE